MSKKNKLFIIIYIMLILLLIGFLIQDYRYHNRPFRCTGDLITSRNHNGDILTMNTTISIVGLGNNKGIIRFKGYIEDPVHNQSILDRTIKFTRVKKNQDMFTTEIDDEPKSIGDTTKDEIFKLFTLNPNNIRMGSKLYGNSILFHDTVTPQFICVTY